MRWNNRQLEKQEENKGRNERNKKGSPTMGDIEFAHPEISAQLRSCERILLAQIFIAVTGLN